MVHIDAYRLRDARELRSIGVEEYLGRDDTVVVIEWGEKVKAIASGKKVVEVRLVSGSTLNDRIIFYADTR